MVVNTVDKRFTSTIAMAQDLAWNLMERAIKWPSTDIQIKIFRYSDTKRDGLTPTQAHIQRRSEPA